MKRHLFSFATLLLAAALLVPFGSYARPSTSQQDTAARQPNRPTPTITTANDAVINKLSPDLRTTLKEQPDRVLLVSARVAPGTAVERVMLRSVRSKTFGAIQWVVGEIAAANLMKLASIPGVSAVSSEETYRPVDAPGLDELSAQRPRLSRAEARTLMAQGGKPGLTQKLTALQQAQLRRSARAAGPPTEAAASSRGPAPATIATRDIHGSAAAQAKGYDGTGVVVAVVDTGVDFAHPDLEGTQARMASGPYAGWPYAYNVLSGIYYALDPTDTVGPDTYWDPMQNTWYVHTLPVTGASCNTVTCTANLKIDFGNEIPGWNWDPVVLPFTWPDTSQSDTYYYTVHPDFNHLNAGFVLKLGYAESAIAPAAVIVADTTTAGVYDTVYVDADFDQDLGDEKPMRRGDEVAGADIFDAADLPGSDGQYDLSVGMLTWIADGTNVPPGVGALYDGVTTPAAGRLLSFFGDEDSHGTNCASDVVAQGVITDPEWLGVTNPLFAGAANVGGPGGPVLAGMAPGARIAAFQNGYFLPDSWLIGVLGFDGQAQTGDESNILSNSFGSSAVLEDGWDADARLVHYINRNIAPNATFLTATGNGGHGYGTVTSPGGGTNIDVGASTAYGSTDVFEFVDTDQFTYGDVTPFSNRGPGALGDLAPDILGVGAWGTGANPLNFYLNGEAAYDTFGGTSMSTPIAAGILAQIYQAYRQNPANGGQFPSYEQAQALLFNGARDLGYDVFSQGAGNVDADRSTDIAAGRGNAYLVTPPQWVAGSYRGNEYPVFPSIMQPGSNATQTFTVSNPTTSTLTVNIADTTLTQVAEVTQTLAFDSFGPTGFLTPTYVLSITQLLATHNPDLVRAQVIFPYNVFDTNNDYRADNSWRALFYDWTDVDGDGQLWTDDNANGIVDAGEIDNSVGLDGVSEYNRFTFSYPRGNYLEVSLGRDSISRANDGVFFGLQRRSGSAAITLQVRITFYRKSNWDWLSTTSSSVNVPAGGSATFDATLAVPPGTGLGAYQGALEVSQGANRHIIPVLAHVAASGATFDFGASSLTEPVGTQPYDNGHLFGGVDWDWRYESGDWRLYYYDVPNGTAAPGRSIIVDTQWVNPRTDVDTWIFGAVADTYSSDDPAFFGPNGVEQVGGSTNTYLGAGVFEFNTATSGPREVVGGELRDGLNFISLHNVLYDGAQFGEPFRGSTYEVSVLPSPLSATTEFGVGTIPISFTTSRAINEGLGVLAFGLSQPTQLTNLTAEQDDANNVYSSSYVRQLTLNNAGLMDITTTSSAAGLDIDLFVLRDGGDGLFDGGDDTFVAASTTATADERVAITLPQNGNYWIAVLGYSVPGGTQPFDMTIEVLQGTNLSISGLTTDPIPAGTTNFTLNYTRPGNQTGTFQGIVFIGPASAPTALRIPVTITFPNTFRIPIVRR